MGPATDKHQAPTHRLKLYVRAVIEFVLNISGYLDSAVTKQGLDCREFLLRDERKDAVKCAFFEIVGSLV